jgi:radical SAM protein with 4Fe4S-binding SPASM domain
MDEEFDLREIKLEVTYRCPLACIHCSSEAGPSSALAMTPTDCFRIVNEAIEMGVGRVAFSGGEPLVWEALDEAVRLASGGGMRVSVYTSGCVPMITDRFGHLARSGLQECIFSVFGGTEAAHERVTRVSGSYRRTREAITAAIECGYRVELHFVPLSDNLGELEPIAEAAIGWGVSRISVLRFVPQGRGSLIRSRMLNRVQHLQLRRVIERLRTQGVDVRTGSPYNFLMLNDQPKCSSGIDRLIVSPDLRIYPCDAFKQVRAEEIVGTLDLSTLREHSLLDCWFSSPFLTAVREYLAGPFTEPCCSCQALSRCLSGCLAQKVIKTGGLVKMPDPMCLMI